MKKQSRKPSSVIREAFMMYPIVVTPHASKIIEKDDLFIPNNHYPRKYANQMIDGEIGVLNSFLGPRRIIVDKYVKA